MEAHPNFPKTKRPDPEIIHKNNVITPTILLKKTKINIDITRNVILIILAFLNPFGVNEFHDLFIILVN